MSTHIGAGTVWNVWDMSHMGSWPHETRLLRPTRKLIADLLLRMTSASAERSCSALRRLKTNLRNTMTLHLMQLRQFQWLMIQEEKHLAKLESWKSSWILFLSIFLESVCGSSGDGLQWRKTSNFILQCSVTVSPYLIEWWWFQDFAMLSSVMLCRWIYFARQNALKIQITDLQKWKLLGRGQTPPPAPRPYEPWFA